MKKLSLKQKIIVGVAIIVIIIIIVLAVVLTKQKQTKTNTITPANTATPSNTPNQNKPTTLIPIRPQSNMINVGFIDAIKADCIESYKTKLLPIKNIILNSYPLEGQEPQTPGTDRPTIVFKLDNTDLRLYIIGLLVDTKDFNKSIYILSLGTLNPDYYYIATMISPPSSINPNNNNGITQINGSVSLKSILKTNVKIEPNFISACLRDGEEYLLATTIEYHANILEAIRNDLG